MPKRNIVPGNILYLYTYFPAQIWLNAIAQVHTSELNPYFPSKE